MENLQKCSVCLRTNSFTVSLQGLDGNNVKWFDKLQFIIPELEWLEQYVICECCVKQLEDAWKFKKFVLSLEKYRKEMFHTDVDENISDNYSTEYCNEESNTLHCELQVKNDKSTQSESLQLFLKNKDATNPDLNLYTCYNCSSNFQTKATLICHIENEHTESKLYSNNVQLEAEELIETKTYIHPEELGENIQNSCKYNCSTCTSMFDTKEMFDYHVENCVHTTSDFPCKKLPAADGSANKIISESIHQELSRYYCEECRISFATNQEYDLHILSEHSPKKVALKTVKKRRGRKPLNKFICEICSEQFDYVKLIIEHYTSVHAMDTKTIKPYSCEKCNMRFASSANLDQHKNYHDKNRSHICTLCGKGFITKSDLTVHEYTHYNRRNYKCNMCDKAFNTNKNLRTHNLVVHTDRSLWKYACAICEKRFPLKTNYEQHLRRHTGEKKYSCHICKKLFISKSELQRHVNMHSNIRAFKCSNCDREYKERRTYQAHLAKKHGIGNVKVTVREKRFVCHICPSQFYDKQKLMRHICSHSGIKPFPCCICDKKFTDKSYLKHHMKTIHNVTEQLKFGNV